MKKKGGATINATSLYYLILCVREIQAHFERWAKQRSTLSLLLLQLCGWDWDLGRYKIESRIGIYAMSVVGATSESSRVWVLETFENETRAEQSRKRNIVVYIR